MCKQRTLVCVNQLNFIAVQQLKRVLQKKIHFALQLSRKLTFSLDTVEYLTPILAAQMKPLNTVILVDQCLRFFRPCCCGEGGGVLTLSMSLYVGVWRNKQLFLYLCIPLCQSTSLTRDAPECPKNTEQ